MSDAQIACAFPPSQGETHESTHARGRAPRRRGRAPRRRGRAAQTCAGGPRRPGHRDIAHQ
eukprot:764370-Pleurochrysis_carterae.AAC.3